MGSLIVTGLTSLDGYITDDEGDFSWATPDAAVVTSSLVRRLRIVEIRMRNGSRSRFAISVTDGVLAPAMAPRIATMVRSSVANGVRGAARRGAGAAGSRALVRLGFFVLVTRIR